MSYVIHYLSLFLIIQPCMSVYLLSHNLTLFLWSCFVEKVDDYHGQREEQVYSKSETYILQQMISIIEQLVINQFRSKFLRFSGIVINTSVDWSVYILKLK